MSLPFGCKHGLWWLDPSRAIVWPIAHRADSTFPSWHSFLLGCVVPKVDGSGGEGVGEEGGEAEGYEDMREVGERKE